MTPAETDTARAAGWARNERERRLIGVDATPAERLAWLEDMIRLAYRTGALPRDRDGEPAPAEDSGS